jgi:hypothetical protein
MSIQFKSDEELFYLQELARNIHAINFDFANKRQLLDLEQGSHSLKLYFFAYVYYKNQNKEILIPDRIWSFLNVIKLYTIQYRQICVNIFGSTLQLPEKDCVNLSFVDFTNLAIFMDTTNHTNKYALIPKNWLYYHFNPSLYNLPRILIQKPSSKKYNDSSIIINNKELIISEKEKNIGALLNENFDNIKNMLDYFCKPSPNDVRLLIVWIFAYKCLKTNNQFLPLNPSPQIDKYWHFLIIHPFYEKFCFSVFDSLFEHNPTLPPSAFDRIDNQNYLKLAEILDEIIEQKIYVKLIHNSILEAKDILDPKESWTYQAGFVENRELETYYDSLPLSIRSDIAHHCYTKY